METPGPRWVPPNGLRESRARRQSSGNSLFRSLVLRRAGHVIRSGRDKRLDPGRIGHILVWFDATWQPPVNMASRNPTNSSVPSKIMYYKKKALEITTYTLNLSDGQQLRCHILFNFRHIIDDRGGIFSPLFTYWE